MLVAMPAGVMFCSVRVAEVTVAPLGIPVRLNLRRDRKTSELGVVVTRAPTISTGLPPVVLLVVPTTLELMM